MRFENKKIQVKNGRTFELFSPSKENAQELIHYLHQLYSETIYLNRYPEEMNFSLENEEKLLEQILYSHRDLMISVADENRIVGNASLYPIHSSIKTAHRCGMGIGILKEAHNMGLGSALMKEIIQAARNIGYEQIELDVVCENKHACHLYQKYGFEIVGKIPSAMKLKEGKYLDEYHMVKFLNK